MVVVAVLGRKKGQRRNGNSEGIELIGGNIIYICFFVKCIKNFLAFLRGNNSVSQRVRICFASLPAWTTLFAVEIFLVIVNRPIATQKVNDNTIYCSQ